MECRNYKKIKVSGFSKAKFINNRSAKAEIKQKVTNIVFFCTTFLTTQLLETGRLEAMVK